MSYTVIRRKEGTAPPSPPDTHTWAGGLYCERCGIHYADYLVSFKRCV